MAIDLSFLIKAKDDTKGGIGSAEKGFKGLAESVKKMGMSQIMMLGGVTLAVKSLIHSYMTQELANKKLETALGHTSQALLDFSSARQKVTRFGDEETTQAMSLTAAYTRNEQTIKRLMLAAQDLAEAKGIDLVSATDMLSKSIFTESNMLKRYGIDIGNTTDSSKKLELATKRLAEMYGGQAVKAMDTASGKLIIMKNNLGDAKETLGRLLLEGLQPMIKLINDLAISFQKLPPAIQQSVLAVGLFLGVLKGLNLALGPLGWIAMGLLALFPLFEEFNKWLDDSSQRVEEFIGKVNKMNTTQAKTELESLLAEQKKLSEEMGMIKFEPPKMTGDFQMLTAEDVNKQVEGYEEVAEAMQSAPKEATERWKELQKQIDIVSARLKELAVPKIETPDFKEPKFDKDAYKMDQRAQANIALNKQMEESFKASLAAQDAAYEESIAYQDELKKQQFVMGEALREEYLMSDQEKEEQSLKTKLAAWDAHWQEKKLGQEIYEKGMAAINKKYRNQEKQMWAQNLQSMGQQAINTLGSMAGNAISSAFQRTFSGIKDGFGRALVEMLSMFVSMVVEMTIRWLAFKALTSMFGAGFFFSQGTSRVPALSFAQGTSWVPKYSQGNMSIPGMLMPTIAYAQSGMQARGSDTVPAMLTPGEAVIPAAQTRKNLPAISQIISGQSPTAGTAKGGDSYNLSFKIDAVDGESVERVVSSASFRKSIVDLIADNKINLKVQNNQVVASR